MTHPSIALIGAPPNPFNLADTVLRHVSTQPDKVALRVIGGDGQDQWTYDALGQAVRKTAHALTDLGLVAGDRILLRLGNTPDFPLTFLAAIYAGLIPIPTSTQLTLPEITAIATQTAPKLIIAAKGIALPETPIDVVAPSDLHAMRTGSSLPAVMGDPNRPAYIIYTSGTSGKPRPVVHAHRAIWARRMMWDGWYGLTRDDVMLHAGAFNWTYTLGTGLLDPWAAGATALIPHDGSDVGDLAGLIAQHDVTLFAAAPGVYRRMLRQDMPDLPALRHGLSAGEKLPVVTANKWEAATGTPVFEAYGMSECSTFISTCPGRPSRALGWPQPGRQVALIGANGPVAEGQSGVIGVHKDDPGLMLGYLDAPAETASRFQGEWFLTGDVGRVLADGAIQYEGRVDDMMNAGGYRVSPIEVENVLNQFPGLAEAAVCEITVQADTSIIAAFYVSPDMLDETQLTAFAAASLARYKVPRQFIRVDSLPRGANNKILRRQLRQTQEHHNGQT